MLLLRLDALDWEVLARARETRSQDGLESRFPADVRALNGQLMTISGYMMPFNDGPRHREFLIGALGFHCVGCMTSDLSRLIAVKASKSVPYMESPITIKGRLNLLEDEQSPLFYRMDSALAM